MLGKRKREGWVSTGGLHVVTLFNIFANVLLLKLGGRQLMVFVIIYSVCICEIYNLIFNLKMYMHHILGSRGKQSHIH